MKKLNYCMKGETMSREHRESYVFYVNFKEAINEVAPSDKLTIYESITNYALYRTEPELEGVAKIVWVLIKPQLDANWRKYEKGCRGGAPKGNQNARKQPQNNQEQPNDNVNVNVKENDNVNVKGECWDNIINNIPLLSDIIAYIDQNGLQVDSHEFHDYYKPTNLYP